MICKKCGELIDDSAKFCPVCGASQRDARESAAEASVLNPVHTHQASCTASGHGAPAASVGFLDAVKLFFRNYANFKGRSRRSEYWFAYLFTSLLSFAVGAIAPDLLSLASLVILIPSVSLSVRRLHDIGKSGWWYLIGLIPVVGSILLIVWFCKDSAPGENACGPNPKY